MAAGIRTVEYRSFEGERLHREAHVGRRIALLLPPGGRWDAATVERIVAMVDAAYDHYQRLTGRQPEPGSHVAGRSTVAAVPSTCGAGCAYLGTQGIELLQAYWEVLHDSLRDRDEWDQVVFYEMGRNFWFLGDILAPPGPGGDAVVTGFAVLNRFTAMQALGVNGAPFNGRAFAVFRLEWEALADRFAADDSLTWERTVGCGQGVPGSDLGATDLFASLIMRLARDHGERVLADIWRYAAGLPRHRTAQDAVDNLVVAASMAAAADLADELAGRWRLPVSARARQRSARCGPAPGR